MTAEAAIPEPPIEVLLVENEPLYREEMVSVLRALGYEVLVAQGVDRALIEHARQLAVDHVPAIAVVDMRLGDDRNPQDTQGLSLIALLRPCLTVISTAYGTKDTIYAALHAFGAANYIGKGEGPEELDRRIRAVSPRFCPCGHSGAFHWHPLASRNPDGPVLTAPPEGARPLSEVAALLDRAAPGALIEQLIAHLASYRQPRSQPVGSLFERYLGGSVPEPVGAPVLRLRTGAPLPPLPDPAAWAADRRAESKLAEAALGLCHRALLLSSILVDQHGDGWIASQPSAGLHHRFYDLICLELDALISLGPDPEQDPLSFYELVVAVLASVEAGAPTRTTRRLLDRAAPAQIALGAVRQAARRHGPPSEREWLWGLLLEALRRMQRGDAANDVRLRCHLVAALVCVRFESLGCAWPPEGWERPQWIEAHDGHETMVGALFQQVRAAESTVVVGIPRMSRLRLLQQFLLRPDVQARYLGSAAASTLLVLVDCDRLQNISERALFELMLTGLAERSLNHPAMAELWPHLDRLRWETLGSDSALLAQRNLEHAVAMVLQPGGPGGVRGDELSLCFLLHTFDAAYVQLGERPLNSLAALAELHWGQLSYVLGLRDTPSRLRPVGASERFERLFAYAPLFIPPDGVAGAYESIMQLERRLGRALPPARRAAIAEASGGHLGLVAALWHANLHHSDDAPPLELAAAAALPEIQQECRALWYELGRDERKALGAVARKEPAPDERVTKLLLQKGLLVQKLAPDAEPSASPGLAVFSPLFALVTSGEPEHDLIRIEQDQVWRGDEVIKLTGKQYELVAFLYAQDGRLCTRDELIVELYGAGAPNDDSAVARFQQVVRRARTELEQGRGEGNAIYLLNVPSRGYRLVGTMRYPALK